MQTQLEPAAALFVQPSSAATWCQISNDMAGLGSCGNDAWSDSDTNV